jgi:hypothetical protein
MTSVKMEITAVIYLGIITFEWLMALEDAYAD